MGQENGSLDAVRILPTARCAPDESDRFQRRDAACEFERDIAAPPATREMKVYDDKRSNKGAVLVFPIETSALAE